MLTPDSGFSDFRKKLCTLVSEGGELRRGGDFASSGADTKSMAYFIETSLLYLCQQSLPELPSRHGASIVLFEIA